MDDRIALIIGVNYYQNIHPLYGCVEDANSVYEVLDRHGNNHNNFDIKLKTSSSPSDQITKKKLKALTRSLFQDEAEIALFYFSGHGYIEDLGGHLVTSDCETGDDGFPLGELLQLANKSPAKHKIIILDCCHAGFLGKITGDSPTSNLGSGLTILTASDEHQYATEKNASGIFTKLLVDALNGSAANIVGDITPGSVYAHIDQSLGKWMQRPILKTNVKKFTSIRRVKPPIELNHLRKITKLFPKSKKIFKLDPSFEFTADEAKPKNVRKFKLLQKYHSLNLVVPTDEEEYMYFAAIHSKGCRLTILGEHYWNLVKNERI